MSALFDLCTFLKNKIFLLSQPDSLLYTAFSPTSHPLYIYIYSTPTTTYYSSSSIPFLPPLSPSLLICSGVVGPPPSLLRCVRRPVAEARCSASTDTADLGGGYCCGGGAGPGGAREASFGGGAPGSGRSIGWEGAGELRRARQQLGGKRWRIWIRGRGAAPATTPSPARRHLETWRPLLSRCCCSSRAGCSPRRPWICDEDLPWRSRRLELGGGSDSGSCSSSSVEVTTMMVVCRELRAPSGLPDGGRLRGRRHLHSRREQGRLRARRQRPSSSTPERLAASPLHHLPLPATDAQQQQMAWVPLLVLSRRPATPPHSQGTGSSRSVVRVFFFCVYFQEAGSVPGADSLGLSALVVP